MHHDNDMIGLFHNQVEERIDQARQVDHQLLVTMMRDLNEAFKALYIDFSRQDDLLLRPVQHMQAAGVLCRIPHQGDFIQGFYGGQRFNKTMW